MQGSLPFPWMNAEKSIFLPTSQNSTRRKLAHRFEREKTICSFPLSMRYTIVFYRSTCGSSFEKSVFLEKLIFQPAWCAVSGPICSTRSSGFRRAERRRKRRRWSGEGFPEKFHFSRFLNLLFSSHMPVHKHNQFLCIPVPLVLPISVHRTRIAARQHQERKNSRATKKKKNL